MTVVVSGGYAWIAEGDAIAHARTARGRAVRTLCGRPAVDERFARPAAIRCPACQEVIDRTSPTNRIDRTTTQEHMHR